MSVTWHEEISLTGRRRFREKKRWFRAPVQVEQVEVLAWDFWCAAGSIDVQKVLIWRDGRLEDYTVRGPTAAEVAA